MAGFSEPTPVQAQAIPLLLAGQDLLALAPTGTGKSAAFLLPLLHRLGDPERHAPRALVLVPTRELALQLSALTAELAPSVRLATLIGGVPDAPQVALAAAGLDLVIATPGRLIDLLRRGHLSLSAVQMLVLDEADQLLDLGFLPDIQYIATQLPAGRQTSLFSATLPAELEVFAFAFLSKPEHIDVHDPLPPLDRIEQRVLYVAKADKHQLLAHVLTGLPRALVFTRTREAADRAVALLESRGHHALSLHANKSQSAREAALAAFRDGGTAILLATDVAARGLHVHGVSHVINFDLPNQPEIYVHRVGRTARAGASGTALSFCDPSEHGYLQAIEAYCKRPLQPDLSHPYFRYDLLPGPGRRAKGRRR